MLREILILLRNRKIAGRTRSGRLRRRMVRGILAVLRNMKILGSTRIASGSRIDRGLNACSPGKIETFGEGGIERGSRQTWSPSLKL